MFCLHDPFGQVIDLLETFPVADRQGTRAPVELQRGLRRVPVPPAPGGAATGGHVACLHRTIVLHMTQHIVELLLEPRLAPLAPAAQDGRSVPQEPPPPVGEEPRGNDGRIMRPVLEQAAITLQQPLQHFRAVGIVAREQDHVVRTLDRGDAVDLHESESFDQVEQAVPVYRCPWIVGKLLSLQQNSARHGRIDMLHGGAVLLQAARNPVIGRFTHASGSRLSAGMVQAQSANIRKTFCCPSVDCRRMANNMNTHRLI